jgi:peptide chain release factor 3
VAREAQRRRTFAVISHPDAGKSTLTEALALHARVIAEAGAVHGKAGRAGVVSDWTEMERRRGISVTAAALQFGYRDTVVNLLDTPGHADFSEDTYRVLAAVDSAVMLVDAARGVEAQTRKLFAVCRARRLPVLTLVNKWDRPGMAPLEMLDEIETTTGLQPVPLTWPVGAAGDFRGLIDRRSGRFVRFTRTPGGARIAAEEVVDADRAVEEEGEAWRTAQEELALLDTAGAEFDPESYHAQQITPVLFGAAVLNFGVRHALDALVDLAPAPADRLDAEGMPRPVDASFAGQVFKVQTGMDPAHRDRVAFLRVCSGQFNRGMVATLARTGKRFTTKYAQAMLGRERSQIDEAYPGDVVGLVNATALQVGDTLHAGASVSFPPLPHFAPEHFAVARPSQTSRLKQFYRAIDQLDSEGVVQVLHSDLRGRQTPVLAAVGPMQFEVAAHRLEHEFATPVHLERLDYQTVRRTTPDDATRLEAMSGVEVLTRSDGTLLAVFRDRWRLASVEKNHPDLGLAPLLLPD